MPKAGVRPVPVADIETHPTVDESVGRSVALDSRISVVMSNRRQTRSLHRPPIVSPIARAVEARIERDGL